MGTFLRHSVNKVSHDVYDNSRNAILT